MGTKVREEAVESRAGSDDRSFSADADGSAGGDERSRRRGGRVFRRRACPMCVDKLKVIDYKDVNFLRRFVSDRARIEPRRKVGTCAKHQRVIIRALKRARHIALIPFAPAHVRRSGVRTSR